jgi:hypothetical protein
VVTCLATLGFPLFFHDLPLSENENMPADLPQTLKKRKDKNKGKAFFTPVFGTEGYRFESC